MKTFWKQFSNYYGTSQNAAGIYDSLCALYSEKHRAYHNLNHINHLLALFERYEKHIEDDFSVFSAIWFHDCIYDPQRNDNEKRSAEFAVERLRKTDAPPDKISKIEKMILATEKHSADELDGDGKLFLDFDLAVLGADEDVYENYAKAIREEYGFVGDEDYRTGRAGVLQNFLRRDFIYLTGVMREALEAEARRNIERELLKLNL